MLTHPTIDKLHQLRLCGMVSALQEQERLPEIAALSFEERLGLLVDREMTVRSDKQLRARLGKARLKQAVSAEEIDFRSARGLDKALFQKLLGCGWVDAHQNVVLTGPTGVGKTFLACALANQACRHGVTVQYFRVPRLLDQMNLARAEGEIAKLFRTLSRTTVIVLDDWGLATHTDQSRRDLLEFFDDRHASGSTIVTSQLPVENWHEALGDPTLADAILDRLVHNAHRITLSGESLRKRRGTEERSAGGLAHKTGLASA